MENSNSYVAESAVTVCINSYNKFKNDQQNAFNAHLRRTRTIINNYNKAGISIDDIKSYVQYNITDKEISDGIFSIIESIPE